MNKPTVFILDVLRDLMKLNSNYTLVSTQNFQAIDQALVKESLSKLKDLTKNFLDILSQTNLEMEAIIDKLE